MQKKTEVVIEVLRLVMGTIFLWAFLDKLLGLGFGTSSNKAWITGVSPTVGFLEHGTRGPLKEVFGSIAGNVWVDWLFMVGMLGVGLSLLTGMGLKIARVSGVLLMLLIYLAAFPPVNNPVLDEHVVYILVIVLITGEGGWFRLSLRGWWRKQIIVRKWKWLE